MNPNKLFTSLNLSVLISIILILNPTGLLVYGNRLLAESSAAYAGPQGTKSSSPTSPEQMPSSGASGLSQERRIGGRFDLNQFLLHRLQRSVRSLAPQAEISDDTEDQVEYLNRLPELIAQAHNDKPSEARALLKRLIQAHLRPDVVSYYANGNGNNYLTAGSSNWQDADLIGNVELTEPNDWSLVKSANLLNDEMIPIATLPIDVSLNQQGQFKNSLAKREYLKHCSFNAISCTKNPYRRP